MNVKFNLILLLLAVFIVSACGTRTAIRPGDSLEVAYEKAIFMYDNGKYRDAARAFETVISISRGTEFGQDAQYLLASSYYKSKDYLIAASEFNRYTMFYPRSERAEEAAFMEAHSYYRMSPRHKLDQTDTYNSIERFQLYLSKYPQSDRAVEAAVLIDEMREKLARKNFEAAEQYMILRQYRSAALYYGLTLERFPETTLAERSLVNQIKAFVQYANISVTERQPERYQEAIDAYETYIQLFPRGLNRTLAEQYVDEAQQGLRKSEQALLNAE